MKQRRLAILGVLVLCASWSLGCNPSSPPPQPAASASAQPSSADEAGDDVQDSGDICGADNHSMGCENGCTPEEEGGGPSASASGEEDAGPPASGAVEEEPPSACASDVPDTSDEASTEAQIGQASQSLEQAMASLKAAHKATDLAKMHAAVADAVPLLEKARNGVVATADVGKHLDTALALTRKAQSETDLQKAHQEADSASKETAAALATLEP